MKRKPKSLIKKFVLRLFAALFCIIAVVFLVFGIKGYSISHCIELYGRERKKANPVKNDRAAS